MGKLWKTAKWLLGASAMFGAFVLAELLRDGQVSPREYLSAAMMAGFFAINGLPLKWSVRQRFSFNFCYFFFPMPAVFFYFGEPFTWEHYVFVPLAIASAMAATACIAALEREESERKRQAGSD